MGTPQSLLKRAFTMDHPSKEDDEELETSIPNVEWTDRDKIEGIKDNVEYILRRHPFFLKPDQFANVDLYLRPEYGTPSFEWDMVDIIDFACEIQNKFSIDISDETMYMSFLQLKDVYNYLYQLKKVEPVDKASISSVVSNTNVKKEEGATPAKKGSRGPIPDDERTLLYFPGQGAQKIGMGKGLTEKFPEAKEMFNKAKEILGYDLLDLCLNGPESKLNSTVYSQPALYVCSMATLAKLKKEDPSRVNNCVACCGLSLGEYTALAFAGVFSFEDGLRLVKARGEAMQAAADADKSGMVSVLGTSLTEAKVSELVAAAIAETKTKCYVSNLLCQGNITVSGSLEACDAVCRLGEKYGATKTVKLNVAGAFHSEFMRPAYNNLKKVLEDIKFNEPKIPVIFNVDAETETDGIKIKDKLLEQLVKPVLWERSMNNCLHTYRLAHIIEVGPGNVLTGLMRRILKSSDVDPKPRPSTAN